MNRAFTEITGYEQSEVVGKTPRAIALCGGWGWYVQQEVQPILVIVRGAEFTAADAIARGTIVAQQAQCHSAD